jgi:xylulokinase
VHIGAVLGVDSSTQSTKVELRDADDGRLLAEGRAPHPVANPPRSEQDPAAWWEAFGAAYAAAGAPRVDAVAVAAQQHGMVVLDARERVLRPAKLWNDTESAPHAQALVERLGAETWAATCGSVPVASFTITKLAWLREREPQVFGGVRRVLLPHDWLTAQLCGATVTDRGDASGTGYWSPGQARWCPELLALVDDSVEWTARLPAVAGPRDAVGKWNGATVAPGTGDNMAAALGLGLRPSDVAISVGTSGTVYAVSAQPTADASGAVAGFADATGRFLPLVCTLNATRVTDAFARVLGVDRVEFDRLALEAPAGAAGLTLLPYLDGERTPNRPEATGVLGGLRGDVTPAGVARAALEGVVCGLLDGLDALVAAGVPVHGGRLVLVGGGARSPAYRRVVADLTGRPVVVPDARESVATGACVQAAAVLQGCPPETLASAWLLGNGRVVEPDPGVDRDEVRTRYARRRETEGQEG